MRLKGITDLSLIEWKDQVSMVIFLHGCPLQCKYCQNFSEDHYDISIDSVMNKIKENKFIDSVVVSGGEPLYQFQSLVELLRRIKEIGLKTSIETSGFYPERLSWLIEQKYLDKVFLDIKIDECKSKSLKSFLVSSGKIDIETRITLFRTFPNIEKIRNFLGHINVLQQGCPENAHDAPSDEKLTKEELSTIAKKYGVKTIRTKEFGEQEI